MTRPRLVVVAGHPATGKTTLALGLAERLGLPVFTKDGIKEVLFDFIGVGDDEWSHRLGRASIEVLLRQAGALLAAGASLVVEANFEAGETRLLEMAEHAGARAVLVLVEADPDEVVRRAHQRAQTGERHAGHLDDQNLEEVERRARAGYDPPDVGGPVVRVDNTDPDAVDFDAVVRQVLATFRHEGAQEPPS